MAYDFQSNMGKRCYYVVYHLKYGDTSKVIFLSFDKKNVGNLGIVYGSGEERYSVNFDDSKAGGKRPRGYFALDGYPSSKYLFENTPGQSTFSNPNILSLATNSKTFLDGLKNTPTCSHIKIKKYDEVLKEFNSNAVIENPPINKSECDDFVDDTPTPEPPTPEDPTDGTRTSCPTSGIYGGYGEKITDIKLFLYATNVTNGTIKLNKPQLEVGTVATDWRPNADEAIKHYTPAYKQVKGLAIQQGSNGKKYLEIPTVEGTIYGADLWGGDTAKLLKDEIAELKEQIKELKNQIK